uniref:Uncharacterized protein n=1 Tax=Chrysotila carterae TaxID=13221 RepID=A0A7S4BHX5_CHRCT
MALLSQPAAGNAGPAIVPPSPPADSTPATSTPGALNCSDATLGISALPAFTSPEEECQFVVQNFEGGCLANLIGIEVFANSAECNWPVCGWTRPADTVAGVCQATCAAQPVPYGPCAPARPPSPPSAPCADLALNLPLELAPAGDPTPEQARPRPTTTKLRACVQRRCVRAARMASRAQDLRWPALSHAVACLHGLRY